MQAAELFDSSAQDYQKKFLDNPLALYQRSLIHEQLGVYLSPQLKILDVGCGPGSDFDFYKSLSLNIDAIDISAEMIKVARKQAYRLGLKARVARSSLEEFVPDILYDRIILNFGTINAVENIKPAMEAINRLLKPGGIVFIVAMPPFHFFSIVNDFFHLRFNHIFNRILKQKTVISADFTIKYYNSKSLKGLFKIQHRQHLCTFLPTPDQFSRSAIARLWTKIFINFDKKMSHTIPELFGADHICYILSKQREEIKADDS